MGGSVCKGEGYSPDDFESQCEHLRSKLKLTDEQIVTYQALFLKYSDGEKEISRDNFISVYEQVYKNKETSYANRVFDTFNIRKRKNLGFVEFALGLAMTDSKDIAERLELAFRMFDADGSGTLSKNEVIDMFEAYYKLVGLHNSTSPTDVANELFDKMDLNKDQKVTYDEFVKVSKEERKILEILNPQA